MPDTTLTTGALLTAVMLVPKLTESALPLYRDEPPAPAKLAGVPEVTAPEELSIKRTVKLPGVPL